MSLLPSSFSSPLTLSFTRLQPFKNAADSYSEEELFTKNDDSLFAILILSAKLALGRLYSALLKLGCSRGDPGVSNENPIF